MSYDRTQGEAWDDGYETAKLKAVKMIRDWVAGKSDETRPTCTKKPRLGPSLEGA